MMCLGKSILGLYQFYRKNLEKVKAGLLIQLSVTL